VKLKQISIIAILSLSAVIIPNIPAVMADSITTISPINEEISLKKTIIPMSIPDDNIFPWGSIRGQASENAERYPIIIQIFKGEDPVHFAQVDARGDGSFEYKFRIKNIDSNTGEGINIFQGEYTVNIFRVIPNIDESM